MTSRSNKERKENKINDKKGKKKKGREERRCWWWATTWAHWAVSDLFRSCSWRFLDLYSHIKLFLFQLSERGYKAKVCHAASPTEPPPNIEFLCYRLFGKHIDPFEIVSVPHLLALTFSWHLEIHMCSEAIEAAEQWNWLANPAQEPDAGTRHFESDIIAD